MNAPALPRMQRSSGESRVVFAVRDGATRLTDLYQRDPCRVLFPDPEPGEPPQAVLVTTSGGVTDGDRLAMAIALLGPPETAGVSDYARTWVMGIVGATACAVIVLCIYPAHRIDGEVWVAERRSSYRQAHV